LFFKDNKVNLIVSLFAFEVAIYKESKKIWGGLFYFLKDTKYLF